MRKILLVFLLVSIGRVSASGEFHIKQTVDYKFDSSGSSTVVMHVSLTNNNANYYASV